jgi:hypothetical protein
MSARRCSHCKRVGHSVNNCLKALSDGYAIHQNVLASIFRQGVVNNHDSIKIILGNYTFHQLKILMRVLHLVGPNSTFVPSLYNLRIISFNNTLLRLKEDNIIVLMYYYLNHPNPSSNNNNNWNDLLDEPTKLDILSIYQELSMEDSVTFDCPICMESKITDEKVICNCSHEFCTSCMDNYLKHLVAKKNHSLKPSCSLCRSNITSVTLHNNVYKEELSNKYFI